MPGSSQGVLEHRCNPTSQLCFDCESYKAATPADIMRRLEGEQFRERVVEAIDASELMYAIWHLA